MAIEVPTAAFLDGLAKAKLLSPIQLEDARALDAALEAGPKGLAAELIRRGWLTPFQVNRLLSGRGDSLVLGPYLLLDRLGQGGMGEVFRARHALMDRVVALKVIRADRLDQPEALGRFRREMQAAAKLAHPNVVLAHDAALDGDAYYLAMEYVEGADLARVIKQRGQLPPAQACDYIRQAALGLQHAHERGLVHRDVKPSNLILATPGNVVKVLDLGMARLRMHLDLDATASDLTHAGSVMGTPDYIAPEQAVDSRTADGRADVYSLGCTLYHLLAGQPPFPGGTLTQKLLRHQQAKPEAVERLCPAAAGALARIVRKMMAKRPEDRYQTPQQVADALAPLAAGAGAPGPAAYAAASARDTVTASWAADATQAAPPRVGPASPVRRRNRVLLLAALAAGLAVVLPVLAGVALILFLLLGTAPSPDTQDAKQSSLQAPPAEQPVGPPDNAGEGEPVAVKKDDGPVAVKELPKMPADCPARLVMDLKGHTGTVQCLAFSPDGKRLASGAHDNQVRLWDGRTGKGQGAPLRHSEPVRALAFAPDAQKLAAASYGGGYNASVKIWDLKLPRAPQTLPWKDQTGTPSLAQVNGLAFSPDGKRLAAAGGPLRIWDLAKAGPPTVHTWQKTLPSYMYGVTFAPDGKTVAAGCHEMGENVRVWPVDDSAEPLVLRGNQQPFGLSHSDVRAVVAYVAGGKRLVRVTSDGAGGFQKPSATVMAWDVAPGAPGEPQFTWRDTMKIPGGAVFAVVGDAKGRLRVAVAAGNPGLGAGLGPEAGPGEVHIWDEATGNVRILATGHKRSVTALAVSPDGSRLATGSADQSAKLWDLTR